jgi:hypothetical protein
VGRWLGLTGGAIAHKLHGRRQWSQRDIHAFLAGASAKLGRPVTYEEAFGSPEAAETEVA